MRFWLVTPLARPVLMTEFMNTISVSLTVRSSSFLQRSQLTHSEGKDARRSLLLDRGTDADGRDGDVLPEELLRTPRGGVESEQLAVHRWHRLEEREHPERVQVLNRLLDVRLKLARVALRLRKALLPRLVASLALSSLLVVRNACLVPAAKLLVSDAHGTDLLDDAVDRAAVGAECTLAALRGEAAREARNGERVEIWATEEREVATVLSRLEHDAGAGLQHVSNRRESEGGKD